MLQSGTRLKKEISANFRFLCINLALYGSKITIRIHLLQRSNNGKGVRMSEKEKSKNPAKSSDEGLGPISRREFTKASIAVLGTGSADGAVPKAADQPELVEACVMNHGMQCGYCTPGLPIGKISPGFQKCFLYQTSLCL
jgi:hypothetical protein